MEDIMKKVHELYDLLGERLATVRARETALAEITAKAKEIDARQKAREEVLVVREIELKGTEGALAEQVKAKELLAEVRKERAALADAEMIVADAEKKANVILKEAQDISDEVKATRERVLANVKQLEEDKKNYKAQVLKELAGKG